MPAVTTLERVRTQVRRGWRYYWRYVRTKTGIHAVATAALTAFGLLASLNNWFIVLALASYLFPPAYLYLSGTELGSDSDPDRGVQPASSTRSQEVGKREADAGGSPQVPRSSGPDLDHDFDGPDYDHDGADFDYDGPDYDADGVDADADGADADADT